MDISLEGIEEAMRGLGYRSGRSPKSRLVQAIHSLYEKTETPNAVRSIDGDDLIDRMWDLGGDMDAIRSKRKNLSSIKSSVNQDLDTAWEEGRNPEGITIGPLNTFVMSDSAKDRILSSFSGNVSLEGGKSLERVAEALKIVSDYLSEMPPSAEGEQLSNLKSLIEGLSEKFREGGEGEIRIVEKIVYRDGTEDEDGGSEEDAQTPENEKGTEDDEVGETPGVDGVDEDVDEFEEIIEEEASEEDELGEEEVDEVVETMDESDLSEEIEEIEDDAEDMEEIEEIVEEEALDEEELGEEEDDELVEIVDESDLAEEIEEIENDAEDVEDIEEIVEEEASEEDELGEEEVDEVVEIGETVEAEGEEELQDEGDNEGGTTELVPGEAEELEWVDESDLAEEIEEIEDETEDEDDFEEVLETDDDENVDSEIEIDEGVEDEGEQVDLVEEFEEVVESDEDDLEPVELLDEEAGNMEEEEDVVELVGAGDLEEVDEVELMDEEQLIEEEDEALGDLEEDAPVEEIPETEVDEVEEIPEDDIEETADGGKTPPAADDQESDVGLPIDQLMEDAMNFEEFRLDEKQKRILAERFDGYLGAMERYYNQYIFIKRGSYPVGAERTDIDVLPQQKVLLSDYYMGKYPVTNALFEVFIERTGYKTTAEKLGYGYVYHGRFRKRVDSKTGFVGSVWNSTYTKEKVNGATWYQPLGPGSTLHQKRNHPVVQVSLRDARTFAAWTGKRLPTEIEWEAAARTRAGLIFPWGNEWAEGLCNHENSGISDTSPVDHFPGGENEEGLADLLGNVVEWTNDECEPKFPLKTPARYFITKGGSWISPEQALLFERNRFEADFTSNILGFRCLAD